MKNVILRVLCWPLYFGTLIALAVGALWGEGQKRWEDGALLVRLRRDSWPMVKGKKPWGGWYVGWGGTTFGFGVMLSPDANETIVEHEMVHVEQLEDATVGGWALGALVFAIVHSWLGLLAWLACWTLTPIFIYLCATLVAWLRSEPNVYRGNALEEAAYNATAARCKSAQSAP